MEDTKEFRLEEISFRSIFIDLLRNAWVILLMVIAASLAVTGVEKLIYVPEYSTSATMVVNAKGSNSTYNSLSLTSQMADIFSEVFSSDVLRSRIAEDLGVTDIEGEISCSIIEETNLIVLRVTSSDPRQAYLIIRSALENYDTVSDYLFSNAVLRTLEEPSVPYSPSNVLNLNRIEKLAMLGAGAVTALGIALCSILRFTVKNKEGARNNLDGNILGTVPFEKKHLTWKERWHRKNRSLLLTSSRVGIRFAESYRKITTRLNHHMRKRNQKVLLVVSVAENEGKSSVAANLALALSEKGKRVALIDLDLKKPAQYKIFDSPAEQSTWLVDYLTGKAEAENLLYYGKETGLFHIFQNTGVRNSGGLLESPAMRYILSASRDSMDYVILDTAPMALSSDAELLLKQTDLAVLVVREDWTDIRAINDAADLIRQSGADFAGFILNAFHKEGISIGSHEKNAYRNYGRNQTVEGS